MTSGTLEYRRAAGHRAKKIQWGEKLTKEGF